MKNAMFGAKFNTENQPVHIAPMVKHDGCRIMLWASSSSVTSDLCTIKWLGSKHINM